MFVDSVEIQKLTDGVCYREKALRYKNNLRYVDLLTENEDGSFHVIDYKSSLAFSDYHVKQVRYYVKAIQEITQKEVRGFISYLLADEVKVVAV